MAKKIRDEEKKTLEKAPSKNKNKLVAIGIIAAIIAGTAYFLMKTDNNVNSAYAAIDGIPCETREYGTFHIHAHLDVFSDGQPVTVPQYIGIMIGGPQNQQVSCLYWLHTHDSSGVIHIEAPQEKNFTLGQFMDVWKSTGTTAPPSGDPRIFVNGQEVSTSLADTILNAHDQITLVYGQMPPNIRTFYQFAEGL
ncbi:MAG TPA: hypothetical protein VJ792_09850 [Candidatus Nitrosotalea sp.]|nr:hypothetical protein [Candidatus Nitrosotalea sp.]